MALAKLKYNHDDKDHKCISDNIRALLVPFLPYNTIKIINVSKTTV